jgi:hypothetical protein
VALVVSIHALAVLEEEGAASGHADEVLHAEGFGDGLFSLSARRRKGNFCSSLNSFCNFSSSVLDAEYVHAGLLEVGPAVAERATLLGAAAGLGLRVEVDEQVALGAFLGEGDWLPSWSLQVTSGMEAPTAAFSRVTEEGGRT